MNGPAKPSDGAPWGEQILAWLERVVAPGIFDFDALDSSQVPSTALQEQARYPAGFAVRLARAACSHTAPALFDTALSLLPHVHDASTRADTLAALAAHLTATRSAQAGQVEALLWHTELLPVGGPGVPHRGRCLLRVGAALLRRGGEAQQTAQRLIATGAACFGHPLDGGDLFEALDALHGCIGPAAVAETCIVHCASTLVSCMQLRHVPTYAALRTGWLEALPRPWPFVEQHHVRRARNGEPSLPEVLETVLAYCRHALLEHYLGSRTDLRDAIAHRCGILEAGRAQPEAEARWAEAEARLSAALGLQALAEPRQGGDVRDLSYLELDELRDLLGHYNATDPQPYPLSRLREQRRKWPHMRDLLQKEPQILTEAFDAYRDGLLELAATARARPDSPTGLCTASTHTSTDVDEPTARSMHELACALVSQPRDALQTDLSACLRARFGAPDDASSQPLVAELAQYLAAPQRLLQATLAWRWLGETLSRGALRRWYEALQDAWALADGSAPPVDAAAWLAALAEERPRLHDQDVHTLMSSVEPRTARACLRGAVAVAARHPEVVRRLLAVRRVDFLDSGANSSTFAVVTSAVVRALDPKTFATRHAGSTAEASPAVPTPQWSRASVQRLLERAATGTGGVAIHVCLGRTLVLRQGPRFIAIKLQRRGEPSATLVHELRQQRRLRDKRTASLVPEGIGVYGSPLRLPAVLLQRVQSTRGVLLAEEPEALVYVSYEDGLWRYVNGCGAQERLQGLMRAASDLFDWLRTGMVMEAVTTKNHNIEAGRRFEWMVDLCQPLHERRGTGRLDRVAQACSFPNVRATGIADLAELTDLHSIITTCRSREEDHDSLADPLPALVRLAGAAHLPTLHVLRVMGDYLLDLTLLCCDGWRRAGLPGRQDPAWQERMDALGAELLSLFARGFAAYTGRSDGDARQLLGPAIDFSRLAAQVATFLVPDNYVDAFDRTLHIGAELPQRRPRDPPYEAALNAREAEALAQSLHRELYPETREVRIDLSTHLRQWLPRVHQRRGVAGFCLDGRHLDAGAFNGPWPFVELERALYVTSLLMLEGH